MKNLVRLMTSTKQNTERGFKMKLSYNLEFTISMIISTIAALVIFYLLISLGDQIVRFFVNGIH